MDRRIDDVRPAKGLDWEGAGELPHGERRVAERRVVPVAASLTEQQARAIHDFTLDYAVMHFEGKSRMCNPAYVVEVLKDMKELPLDLSVIGIAPVAAALPASDERMTIDDAREYLVQFMERHFTDKTFHRYIRGQRDSANLAGDFAWQMATALRNLSAAPVLPVEQPSQPQDQTIPRTLAQQFGYPPIAEPDTAAQATSESLNNGMHASIFVKVWGDAGGGDAGRIALANYAFDLGVKSAATQAPSESIDTQEYRELMSDLFARKVNQQNVIDYIHSWHQRATQAAKPLTDEAIFKLRDTIKPGDGWDGDCWDLALAYAVQSHLKGE